MMTLADYLKQQEKAYIEAALKRCDGSVDNAALSLGLPKRTLYFRLKRLRMFAPLRPRSRLSKEERAMLPKHPHRPRSLPFSGDPL
jgi:hypothetical protein